MFIAVEGADGSGKTTQIGMLHAEGHLERLGVTMIPAISDSPVGRLARQMLAGGVEGTDQELQAVLTADRVARTEHLLRLLSKRRTILSDRWSLSALVYGSIRLEQPRAVRERMAWILYINQPVLRANHYIVLRVPKEVTVARVASRPRTTEIYEDPGLAGLIVERYEMAINFMRKACPDTHFHDVDGSGSPGDVHMRMVEVLEVCCLAGTAR